MKSALNHPAMHLGAAELVSAEARCPACGAGAPRARAGRIQRHPDVHLLRCADCGACSASHMPHPDVLDAYYHRHYCHGQSVYSMPQVDRFVNRLLRLIPVRQTDQRVRILDFGGGDGTLGIALARNLLASPGEARVAYTLVDYREPFVVDDDRRLEVTHRQKLDEVEADFDIVLASAVLEHIPELQPVMDRLFGLIAPGGWFYARTPWVAPFKRLIPRLDLTYPGHVHDLGAPFWNRVPTRWGGALRIVASRPSLVETHLRRRPVRAAATWLFKLPARIELAVSQSPRTPLWPFVGGWEVVLRRENTVLQ